MAVKRGRGQESHKTACTAKEKNVVIGLFPLKFDSFAYYMLPINPIQ